ncbi:amino acid aminotransferase [Streptomyces apocyni]|uniref:amino acid aminotransferase n=1 Tax=Streptomyces apocyni TaxID=2654677 RepID=UPI0012EAF500|nr:amino acid aminotransferase [Streptomyces apocyni]
MLELLPVPPADPLWDLAAAYATDTRPDRLNLVVGVYRDHTGATPVMAAVREAEIRLAERSVSKEYRGLSGNLAFNQAMVSSVLGVTGLTDRAAAVQTVAGTGALRLLADLVRQTRPGATVWISDPAYVNHRPILEAAGLTVRTYTWLDAEGRSDPAGMLQDLQRAERDDVVLLQGCCHNPSGVDLSFDAWQALAGLAERDGWVPFIDLAYHGLGDGLEADLRATRMLATRVPEMLISVSCSKNFGLYSDRTGCAIVLSPSHRTLTHVETALQNIARTLYSMPPEHGAAVVTTILEDAELRATWRAELDAMRGRISANRADLVAHLSGLGHTVHAETISRQKGMFSTLPLSPGQMRELREQFAIYGTASGRVNIAGIAAPRIPYLAQGIAAVLARSGAARPAPSAVS